jgi:hypothetical protein
MSTKYCFIICDINRIPPDIPITDYYLRDKKRIILKITTRVLLQIKKYEKDGFKDQSIRWMTRKAEDILNDNGERWWSVNTIVNLYRYGEVM